LATVLAPPEVRTGTSAAVEPDSFLERISNKLSRVTSSGEFIAEIDGLRFIAIAAVVLHHITAVYLDSGARFGPQVHIPRDWRLLSNNSPLILGIWQGYFGVHLFFVISGFVLGLPFVREQLTGRPAPSIKSYFLRRITRIEPPYILNLLVCFGLMASFAPVDTWKHLVASLLYVHNLVYSQGSTLNGVAWSLEIEVQFYILAPLFARAAFAIRRDWLRRTVLAAAILGFSVFTQFVLWMTGREDLKMSLLGYVQFFLAGFLLADLHQTGTINNRRNSRAWDAIGIAGAVVTLLTMMYWRKWLFCALPFFVLVFYAGAFQGRLLRRFFVARPIVIIGGMCYTIYLYHVPIISLFKPLVYAVSAPKFPLWLDLIIQMAVFVPLILVICAVLFVYTEKPFMAFKKLANRGERHPQRPSSL
jgi:peptidoglycan/LPS O-acetylase OafA/YrhL